MWYMYEGMGWWMVIVWGGLIALIAWGIMRLSRRNYSTPKHEPLNMAKERYAKGEIPREEFSKIKKDLY
ncbi:SHOCT domain-containing protein [Chloroflexota bacterium]